MKPLLPALIALTCIVSSFADDNRFKSVKIGEPIFAYDPTPNAADLIDALYASHDQKLLSAIGRGADQKPGMGLSLVWLQPVALYEGDYLLSVFDSPGHVEPGDNPRVLVLLDRHCHVVTWGRFTCEPPFGYASIAQSPLNQETHLITVNRSDSFGGELWFERYKIEPAKITKLGEGTDPQAPLAAERDAAILRP